MGWRGLVATASVAESFVAVSSAFCICCFLVGAAVGFGGRWWFALGGFVFVDFCQDGG